MSMPVSALGKKIVAAWFLLACAPTAALTNASTPPSATTSADLTSASSAPSSVQHSEAAAAAAAARAAAQVQKTKHAGKKATDKVRKDDAAVAMAKAKRAVAAVQKAAAADSQVQMQENSAEVIAEQYSTIAKNLSQWSAEEVQHAKLLNQRASAAVADKEAATKARNTESNAVSVAETAEAAAEGSEREAANIISHVKLEEKHAHGLEKELLKQEAVAQHAIQKMEKLKSAEETEVAEEHAELEKASEVKKKVAARTAKSLKEDASRRANGAKYLAEKSAAASHAEEAARQEVNILAKREQKLAQDEATEKKNALRYAQPQQVMLLQGAAPYSVAVCVSGVFTLILASWFVVPTLRRHTYAPQLEQQLLGGV